MDNSSSLIQTEKRALLKGYLQESMYWNRELVEHNQDAFFALDLAGYFISLNPACERITGYQAHEATKLMFSKLVKAEDADKVYRYFLQTLEGNIQNYDCTILNKNGHYIELNITNLPLSVNDEIVGVYGVAKDITEIKLIRQRRTKCEEFYRILADKSMDIITISDMKGDLLYVSSACLQVLGYDPQEIVGKSYRELIHMEDIEKTIQIQQIVAKGEGIARSSHRARKKDGTYIWMDVQYIPILDIRTNSVKEVITVSRDITELKATEEEVFHREIRYQNLVEHSPDAIIIFKPGKILFVNNAAVHLLGASNKEDLINKDLFDFLYPEHHEIAQQLIRKVNEGKPLGFVEQKLRRLDGAVFEAEIKGIPSVFGGEKALHFIVRDISQRKKTQELMLKSERLTIAGQLAAGIAHEVRNPLTAIKGFLQLMEADHSDDRGYFNIIYSEMERIELILSELLTLTKPKKMKYEMKSLKVLLDKVKTLLGTQAILENIEIQTNYGEEIPPIICDENQLKQVFINLLKNSIEAMPNGGMITIEVNKLGVDQVQLLFSDQGSGITEEVLQRIGEPFFTTKESGTGLGLMISKQIIENHSGSLHIKSTKDGTTMEIILPIKKIMNGTV